jgi:23S rRNA pseudouridine1911/1915/1917 synthase
VNALIAHCGASLSGIGGVRRPGIVHRLDKDTSGLFVVAKTDKTHRGLAEQFAKHGSDGALERQYRALVWGVPSRAKGSIEGDIGRSPANRQKMAVTPGKGRPAVTHYVVEERFGREQDPVASLLTLRLETGRTHQIRVHLVKLGHPVIGDATYGAGMATKAHKLPDGLAGFVAAFPRQALHAATLGFRHPVTGEAMAFTSPLPADMAALVAAFRSLGRQAIRGPAR